MNSNITNVRIQCPLLTALYYYSCKDMESFPNSQFFRHKKLCVVILFNNFASDI